MKKLIRGFTIIELVIAIALIGIIATLAVPSYIGYIQQERFAEGTQSLINWASRLENQFMNTRQYSCILAPPNDRFFNFSCSLQNGNGYLLTATSSSQFDSNRTFTFNINNNGARSTVVQQTSTVIQNQSCWIRSPNGTC